MELLFVLWDFAHLYGDYSGFLSSFLTFLASFLLEMQILSLAYSLLFIHVILLRVSFNILPKLGFKVNSGNFSFSTDQEAFPSDK